MDPNQFQGPGLLLHKILHLRRPLVDSSTLFHFGTEQDRPVKNSPSKIFPLEEVEFSLSSKNHFKFPKEFVRCLVKLPLTGLERQAVSGEQRAHDARRVGRDVAAGEELGGEGEEGDDGRCKAC